LKLRKTHSEIGAANFPKFAMVRAERREFLRTQLKNLALLSRDPSAVMIPRLPVSAMF
jgi:hypothetical protein